MIARTKIITFLCIFFLGFGVRFFNLIEFQDQDKSHLINPLAIQKTGIISRIKQDYWSKKVANCLDINEKIEQGQCLNKNIIKLTKDNGARFALDVIQPLAQKHPEPLLTLSHEYAHLVGDYALDHDYKVKESIEESNGFSSRELNLISRIGIALVDCDGWGAFGCYHGVIEVGLSRLKPDDRTRVIRKACMENESIQQHQAYVNQCLHWFGHGMAVFTDQPLEDTLKVCSDLNPTSFPSDEVQLCVSGVFHAGAVPGEVDEEYNHFISRVYSPTDPYFPCEEVEDKYKGQCYSQLVGRSGDNLETQFTNCNNIPESNPEAKDNYVRRCYNSGANNLLVQAKFDVSETIKLCRNYSKPEYIDDCYGGAIRYSILRDPLLNNRFPFEMCSSVDDSNKPACYRALGAANYENYFDNKILDQYCMQVDSIYYDDCMSKDPLQAPIVVDKFEN